MKKLGLFLGLSIIVLFISLPFSYGAENKLASSIATLAQMITKQFGIVDAVVAAVDGDNIYLNVGKNQYITEGTLFEIIAQGSSLTNPVNRSKLGNLESHIADVKIVTVRDNFCIGQVINSTQGVKTNPIKVGQKALQRIDKISIAVVRFDYLNSKDAVTPRVAQELMIDELIKTGRFVVAESSTTDEVVQQLLGTNTPGTNPFTPDAEGSVQFTRNLGKLLGVDFIMYGQLTDLPGVMEIQCRVHDVKSGIGIAAGDIQIVAPVVNPPLTP